MLETENKRDGQLSEQLVKIFNVHTEQDRKVFIHVSKHKGVVSHDLHKDSF